MSLTQPISQIEYTRKEVVRFRDVVRDFRKNGRDTPAETFRAETELVAKANVLFDQIMDLDTGLQELFLVDRVEFDEALQERIYELLRDWLAVSLALAPRIARLEADFGAVNEAGDFRRNVRQAESILTPDGEFFRDDRLSALRERAIDDHHAGRTEPLDGIDEVE